MNTSPAALKLAVKLSEEAHKLTTEQLGDLIATNMRIAFLSGKIEGITDYAIWRNGEQLVGCMETPLKEVRQPMLEEIVKLESTLP